MYGLAMSLRAYENLLLANEVHVFTYNTVVVQLQKYQPMNAREKRLIAYLSQFRLNIRFVQGVHNYTADCLSRIYDDLHDSQMQRLRPDDRMLREEFILPVTCDTTRSQRSHVKADVRQEDESTMSQNDRTIEIDPGQWAAYFFNARSKRSTTKAQPWLYSRS